MFEASLANSFEERLMYLVEALKVQGDPRDLNHVDSPERRKHLHSYLDKILRLDFDYLMKTVSTHLLGLALCESTSRKDMKSTEKLQVPRRTGEQPRYFLSDGTRILTANAQIW